MLCREGSFHSRLAGEADSLTGAASAPCVTGLREGADPSTNNKDSSAQP